MTRKRITCPLTAHLAEIEFNESPEDGHILGVTFCDHFEDGEPVCDQLCIRLLNKRRRQRLRDRRAGE